MNDLGIPVTASPRIEIFCIHGIELGEEQCDGANAIFGETTLKKYNINQSGALCQLEFHVARRVFG